MAKLLTGTRVYGTANVDNVLTVGNITPVNSTSNTTGSLIVVGGVGILGNTYTGNLVISGSSAAGNGITFADGTRQTSAFVGSSIDQYARDTANLSIGTDVTQNTRLTVIEGVDSWQNNAIIVLQSSLITINSNSAYSGAIDVTQNARMLIIEGTDLSQNVRIDYSNTRMTITDGVDLGQNTAIAATDGKMQSSYNQANTGTVLAQAAFNQANTGTSGGSSSGYLANSVIFANTTGYLSNTANILFFAANNNLFVSGNVGIGTTNPATKLEVVGNVNDPYSGTVKTTNSNVGAAVQTGLLISNGTQSTQFTLAGTGYGGYGAYTAGNALVYNQQAVTIMADQASTGIIKFATGGNAERMRIDTSGNLGIGTSSPGAKLHVYGANFPLARIERVTSVVNSIRSTFSAIHTTTGDMVDGFGSDISFGIRDSAGVDNEIANFGAIRDGADNSGALVFSTVNAGVGQGVTKMILKADGNLGIGTTTPANKFQTTMSSGAGSPYIGINQVSDNPYIEFQRWSGGGVAYAGARIKTTNEPSIIFENSNTANIGSQAFTERMRIDASGNLGIGTSSPAGKLEVVGDVIQQTYLTSTASNLFITKKARGTISAPTTIVNGDTVGGLISGGYDGSAYRYTGAMEFLADGVVSASTVPMAVRFSTGTTTSYTERMRITSAGNVGIGTASPSAKLDVNGQIFVRDANGIATDRISPYAGLGLSLVAGSSPMLFTVNSAERMRINSSGQVGIGTTSLQTILDTKGGASYFGGNFTTLAEAYGPNSISAKGAYDLAGTVVTIGSLANAVNAGALINFNAYNSANGATGAFCGAVAGATGNGPANFVIGRRTATQAWAESLRVDTAGNVGIGTNAPTGKLDVVGSGGTVRVESGGDSIAFTKNGLNYLSAKGGSSGAFVFETGGAVERMRIFSSGGVSIGNTTDPGATNLSVTGSFEIPATTTITTYTNDPTDSTNKVFAYKVYPKISVNPASLTNGDSVTVGQVSGTYIPTSVSANTIYGYGLFGIISSDAATPTGYATTDMRGIYGNVYHNSASNLLKMVGAAGRTYNRSTGTVGNAYSLWARNSTNTGGGTITASYGVYIDSISSGATNYALYSAGGQSYFTGNVGIGSGKTTPATALDVNGTVTATSFSGAGTGLTGTAASLTAGTATTATTATNQSGGTVSATSIFGTSVNIAGNGSGADPYGTIAITEPASAINYSYYGLTRAGQLGAGFGLTGTNGALGVGANSFWFGNATAGSAGAMSVAWVAFNAGSFVTSGSITGTSFSGAGTGLTGTAASLSIGGTAAGETLTTVTNRGNITTGNISTPASEGTGYSFWGDTTNYKISMGVTVGLYQYGPVTDYSIKTQMDAASPNRGFTWGGAGAKPTAALSVSGNMQIAGTFSAASKSFLIPHPTKEGKQLRYGSLESPYHGVRLTGEATLTDKVCRVDLPDYIHGLCKQEGSQVQITNIKHGKVLWVENINVDQDYFEVSCNRGLFDNKAYSFYWSFTAVRKDIEDMEVEIVNE